MRRKEKDGRRSQEKEGKKRRGEEERVRDVGREG